MIDILWLTFGTNDDTYYIKKNGSIYGLMTLPQLQFWPLGTVFLHVDSLCLCLRLNISTSTSRIPFIIVQCAGKSINLVVGFTLIYEGRLVEIVCVGLFVSFTILFFI